MNCTKAIAIGVSCLFAAWTARAGILENDRIPFEQQVLIDCDQDGTIDDELELAGDLHIVVTQTVNTAGLVKLSLHFQPVNVSAVGLITGDTYRAVGVTRQNDVVIGEHEAFTLVNNFHMVGQASGFNYFIHETFHITVVSGQVVVELDHADTRCH